MLSSILLASVLTAGDYAVYSLLVMDAAQTAQISEQPAKYKETNPFLPEHPSKHQVYQHFIAAAVVYTLVAEYAPQSWRNSWMAGWIVAESYTVASNWRLGLKVEF